MLKAVHVFSQIDLTYRYTFTGAFRIYRPINEYLDETDNCAPYGMNFTLIM